MRTNALLRFTTIVVLVLALAACGDDDDEPTDVGSDPTTTTTTAPDGTTTAPEGDLTVTVKEDRALGAILADAEGRTLYTLTDDAGEAVECTGSCLGAWPALELPSGEPVAPEGVDLTVVDGPDGMRLVAADGLPLYTFAGDASPDDAKGEGLVSFGGTWKVVKTDAAPTAPAGSGGSGGDSTTSTSSTY